jgi:hypothetical protein
MAQNCEGVSGVSSCRPIRNQPILVLWETTLPPARRAKGVSQPLCCVGMLGAATHSSRGPCAGCCEISEVSLRRPVCRSGDPGSIGSHIRLGQLQSRRLELEHIRVAMRRVSKGNMSGARRLGIGELSGGRADGGAIVAPPCTAPAQACPESGQPARSHRETDASHRILTCGRRRCRTS